MMNEDDKTKKDNKSLNYLLGLGIVVAAKPLRACSQWSAKARNPNEHDNERACRPAAAWQTVSPNYNSSRIKGSIQTGLKSKLSS